MSVTRWTSREVRRANAIFSYTDVLKRFPETSVASAALHKIVYAYVEDSNYAQAIQLAEEFERRFPGDPLLARVHVLQGFAHYQLEQFDEALPPALKALEISNPAKSPAGK